MINNNIGPDKGLLEMVFGKKETAQAAEPVVATPEGGDGSVQQVPEDFMAMLAKSAQDQKDAAAAAATAQTKGESKQVTKSAGSTDAAKKEAAAALAKQKGKAGVTGAQNSKGGPKGSNDPSAEEEARAKAKAAQATAAAQAAGVLQGHAPAKPAAPEGAAGPKALPATTAAQAQQLQQLQAAQTQQLQAAQTQQLQAAQTQQLQAAQAAQAAAARNAASAAGGVPGVGQQSVLAAQQAAVTAQQAAVTAQQAAQLVMQHGLAQSQQAQTVVQPIVIQVPMAIPVEVLGMQVDDADLDQLDLSGGQMGSAVGGSKPQLTTSQDFLAQMGVRQGGVLGVDRVDPRLGRLNDERQNEQSGDGSFGMLMPQLSAQYAQVGQYGSDTTTAKPVTGSVQMTVDQSGKPVLANTMALANEVAAMAARGGGAVRVRIVPENLGEMTISVKTEGQHLNVQIETATSAARDAVASAMPELRQMLTAGHYKVGSLEVNHAAGGGQLMVSQASDGVGIGMSQWSNQSSFSDWQGGRQQHDDQQGGSAWDRYRSQQEARQEARQQQQYRQQNGYRRYQQEQLEA
ncbi:MAG: flagellar hook-length control protein FliK [Deltaproteobacteria bacterium]|nr:flagellar hook-length control protein FliK [Deltaproteobacteria bacterium]